MENSSYYHLLMPESNLLIVPNQVLQIFTGSITAQFKIAGVQGFYRLLVGRVQAQEVLDVFYKVGQLLVFPIIVVRQDRNAVVRLVEVGVSCVINQKNILQLPIFENSKVFHVNPLFGLPAMRAEKAMAYELSLRIQVIQYHIGVALMTGSEDYYFAYLGQFFEEFYSEWSHIDSCINLLSCWELDLQSNIMRNAQIFITVDECLIQIQYDGMLDYIR